ncbi:MAG: XdhC family protein, partial [Candidatus Dormibacteraceae bacterium]
GGTIHLFVERLDWKEAFGDAAASIRAGEPVSLVTELEGPHPGAKLVVRPDSALGRLEPPSLQERVVSDARAMLAADLTGVRRWGSRGEARREDVEFFVQSFATVPRMYVFGATDFAQATARMGKFLGYHVTVCDARATFATRLRFPDADELVVRWPDEFLAEAPVDSRTAICVLTHDPKFDVPLLQVALGTEAGYIGAMGSRRTDDERAASLREAGIDEQQMARIRGPVGLDIGARTAQEVAVAIAAEIIALRYGSPGRFLHDRRGAVHRSPSVDRRAVTAASA